MLSKRSLRTRLGLVGLTFGFAFSIVGCDTAPKPAPPLPSADVKVDPTKKDQPLGIEGPPPITK